MRQADAAGRAVEAGLAIARELADEIRPLVQGVQISTAPKAVEMALGLLDGLGTQA
jgi:hypothetical protein